ncbi:MAG: DNA polymerase III subunit delta [Actinomycetota bacterium]|nr:MAG: DNA polymerase III subunit delta [Actinomycetota bacterium]
MTPGKAPVHLLYGPDPFLLREAAHEIVGPGAEAREVAAGEWEGSELADLATPSLFGEPRALIVTDCRSLPDQALRELAAYLAHPDPSAALVLCATVGERGKAPAALVKLVEPVGTVREVAVGRKDLPGWLARRAAARGVELAADAAAALVETIGEDPAALAQALEQLRSAFPGERLGRDHVERQFRGLGERHVWDLCDAAFGHDAPGAMRALRTLLAAREDPLMVLGGIASRLRDLLRVRSLPDRMPLAEVARAAGLRFEWQARRYRDQARRTSLARLVEIHGAVVEADRALKSGADAEIVLPVLVARIAAAEG